MVCSTYVSIFDDINDMWVYSSELPGYTHAPLKRIHCVKRPTPWLTQLQDSLPEKCTAECTHDPADADQLRMMCTAKLGYIKSLLTHSQHSPKLTATQ